MQRLSPRTKAVSKIALIVLKQEDEDVDANTLMDADVDTDVGVDVDMIARQYSGGPSGLLRNQARSALKKMAQPTLEKCQQTMQVLKKSTQLKTKMTKILMLILKKSTVQLECVQLAYLLH